MNCLDSIFDFGAVGGIAAAAAKTASIPLLHLLALFNNVRYLPNAPPMTAAWGMTGDVWLAVEADRQALRHL